MGKHSLAARGLAARDPAARDLAARDPFAEYHRSRRQNMAGRFAVSLCVGAAIVGAIALIPVPAVAAHAVTVDSVQSTPLPVAPPNNSRQNLPVAAAHSAAKPVHVSRQRSWTIAIDTVGFQAELDKCLWVRMDLGIPSPLVGAHNNCGGDIVLAMTKGDTVALSGEELTGRYIVTDYRNARVGESAAHATASLMADVILQTCYPGANGRVRLVALTLK
jgi:hypothetical protein